MRVHKSTWHYRLWHRAYVAEPGWLHPPQSWAGWPETASWRQYAQRLHGERIVEEAEERRERFAAGRYSLCRYFWSVVVALTIFTLVIRPLRWMGQRLWVGRWSIGRVGLATATVAILATITALPWVFSAHGKYAALHPYAQQYRQWEPNLNDWDLPGCTLGAATSTHACRDMGFERDMIARPQPWTDYELMHEFHPPWWGWTQADTNAWLSRMHQRTMTRELGHLWDTYLAYDESSLLADYEAFMRRWLNSDAEERTRIARDTVGEEQRTGATPGFSLLFDLSRNDFDGFSGLPSLTDLSWSDVRDATALWVLLAFVLLAIAMVRIVRFCRTNQRARSAWGRVRTIWCESRELLGNYLRAVKQRACPFLTLVESNGVKRSA